MNRILAQDITSLHASRMNIDRIFTNPKFNSEVVRELSTTLLSSPLKFKAVASADMNTIMPYLKGNDTCSTDFTYGGILIWNDYFHYEYAIFHDTLFLKGVIKETGMIIYHLPLGALSLEQSISILSLHAKLSNQAGKLMIPEKYFDSDEYPSNDNIEYLSGWKEYLYPIERFTHFAGKKMEKKRNHLNYFLKNFTNYSVKPIAEADIEELIDFSHKYMSHHENSPLFLYESSRTIDMIRNYSSTPFEGIVARVGDKIIGYSFGERIGNTFFIHAEKGNIEYRGAYQAVASFLAQYVTQKYPEVEYLNREDDMGEESLRESKMSYHPSLFVFKRIISIP